MSHYNASLTSRYLAENGHCPIKNEKGSYSESEVERVDILAKRLKINFLNQAKKNPDPFIKVLIERTCQSIDWELIAYKWEKEYFFAANNQKQLELL
jgi:hypothetical protein